MHELGLCDSIVDAIEKRAGERPVAHVRVHVGRLHHVHPEAFDQSFAVATVGTVAEGADVDLVLQPVRTRCGSCHETFESDEILSFCPGCGSVDTELVGGDDLVLESIQYRA